MQPKQNPWNLVLFVILTALVLAGWSRLQPWLWPVQSKPQRPVALTLDSRTWTELLGLASGSAATSAVSGVGNLSLLSVDVVATRWTPHDAKTEVVRKSEKKPETP